MATRSVPSRRAIRSAAVSSVCESDSSEIAWPTQRVRRAYREPLERRHGIFGPQPRREAQLQRSGGRDAELHRRDRALGGQVERVRAVVEQDRLGGVGRRRRLALGAGEQLEPDAVRPPEPCRLGAGGACGKPRDAFGRAVVVGGGGKRVGREVERPARSGGHGAVRGADAKGEGGMLGRGVGSGALGLVERRSRAQQLERAHELGVVQERHRQRRARTCPRRCLDEVRRVPGLGEQLVDRDDRALELGDERRRRRHDRPRDEPIALEHADDRRLRTRRGQRGARDGLERAAEGRAGDERAGEVGERRQRLAAGGGHGIRWHDARGRRVARSR
jgi:hypothetical protein